MANIKKFDKVSKILFRTESTTKERIEKELVVGQSMNDFVNDAVLEKLEREGK